MAKRRPAAGGALRPEAAASESRRRRAERAKGLSLHDRGFNLVRGNDMTAVRDAKFRDERDVFEYLGLEYVPPEDRSV